MLRLRRRLGCRREHGAAAVEAALVLPLIFLILFGIVQFGLAWFRAQNLEAAAREGARLASVGYTFGDVQTRVRDAQEAFTDADIDVSYSVDGGTSWFTTTTDRPCAQAGLGNLVHVRAQVPADPAYAILIPLWGDYQISYESIGVFRCEEIS